MLGILLQNLLEEGCLIGQLRIDDASTHTMTGPFMMPEIIIALICMVPCI